MTRWISFPVKPSVDAQAIREYLSEFDFKNPVESRKLVATVSERIQSWNLHTPHPRYFGLFNPSPNIFGIVADLLVAGFNPQVGAWHHSPIGVEIERHLIKYFAGQFGLPDSAFGHFTSGGSEANFSAVVVALTRIFDDWARKGARGLSGQPTLYCSAEFHHSFVKIAHQCGLGRNAVRKIPVTERNVMDVGKLRQQLTKDKSDGMLPFLVVATAGTTNAGLVEPLEEIAEVAKDEGIHLHVDAAWGGSAILSNNYRHLLDGIGHADTITFDPHKLMSVPMGAGVFLVRQHQWLHDAFGLITDYVPRSDTENLDNYQLTCQFSRRFIGLKIFMTLAGLGREGLANAIDHQFEMASLAR